jgi:chloramphenicol 3-O phosphotransferase
MHRLSELGDRDFGQIVVLNGAPRSGKSSIAAAIQESFDGPWLNLGVDVARAMTPPRWQPGVGLRPGDQAHPAAPHVPVLYAALYDSIAAHSRLGLNVVVDVGHHDVDLLADCARRLAGLPVLFVGVRCPIEVIMARRDASPAGSYATSSEDGGIPEPVLRWQRDVHEPGIYDLEVDTSDLSPAKCAEAIRRRLEDAEAPTAFRRLAARAPQHV